MKLVLSLFACLVCFAFQAAPITLAWNASPSSNVTSYVLYWGTNNNAWFQSTNVGPELTATVDLPPGTWFFVVTARNSDGLESDPSNPVWTTLGTNRVAAPGLKGVTTTSQLEAAPNVDGPWLPLLDLQTVTIPRTDRQRFVRARMTELKILP